MAEKMYAFIAGSFVYTCTNYHVSGDTYVLDNADMWRLNTEGDHLLDSKVKDSITAVLPVSITQFIKF